jgi:hypothetical protein
MEAKKPYVSPAVEEMEKGFRDVRKDILARCEAEMESYRHSLTIQYKSDEERVKEGGEDLKREFEKLKTFGIDEAKAKEYDKEDEKKGEEYAARVEPKLIAALPDEDDLHRERAARTEYYNRLGLIQPVCVGADVLATDEELLEIFKAAGKTRNPGIWFNDPSDVRKVKLSDSGSWLTTPCTASALTWGKFMTVVWHYIWTPLPNVERPNEPVWNWIVPSVGMLGFYYIHARDKWWNCKHAWVYINARIELFQNFNLWGNTKNQLVLFEEVKNGTKGRVISENVSWDEWAQLQPNIGVFFSIIVRLGVDAKGGGSKAVLNFLAQNGGLNPALLVGL